MNRLVIASLLVCGCIAMPQLQPTTGANVGNPFVRILQLESYQNGADFGHTLQQEDGTAAGQKIGPDGLTYGFYSYVQPSGNNVKVYYRAGKGVGYEVLKVEGLDEKGLGNLRHLGTGTPEEDLIPRARPAATRPVHRQQVVRRPPPPPPQVPQIHIPQQVVQQVVQQQRPRAPLQAPAQIQSFLQPRQQVRRPAPVAPRQPVALPQPVIPQRSILPAEPEFEPHRFDYPANLNLERTGTGFVSSFKAL